MAESTSDRTTSGKLLQERIDRLKEEIAKLEDRTKAIDPAGESDVTQSVERLREHSASIREEFKQLRDESDSTWTEIKDSLRHSIDEADAALARMAKRGS